MWKLSRKNESQDGQSSYVGGKPSIPAEVSIPTCRLCEQKQTFIFQVAFPPKSDWHGRSLACFACMRCADENFLIPEMLSNHLQGHDIPGGFLDLYQKNFAFLVFPTDDARMLESYDEQVAFSALDVTPGHEVGDFAKIGGAPDWMLDDESPATYDSNVPMVFLIQLVPGLQFDIVDGAPPQTELDIMGNPSPSPLGHYQLFLGNTIYMFGTTVGDPLVYAITQI